LFLIDTNNDIFICGGKQYAILLPEKKKNRLLNYYYFYFIGQNEVQSPFQIYLGSQNDQLKDMTAILDTNSWTWRIPAQSSLYQPYPQSFATLSIVNQTKLVFGYGKTH
jgi:hypothetical protein